MIPLCHKCVNALVMQFESGAREYIGCKEERRIKKYADAKRLCPVIFPSVKRIEKKKNKKK